VFERFERSWNLARACARLLREDPSLLVFPLMSLAALVVILASFAVPLLPLVALVFGQKGAPAQSWLGYALLFLFYWIEFSVVIFFNTALVEVALKRFDGQAATIGDGLRRAWSQLGIIVAYALIAATVGIVLRYIAERVGLLGKIVIGIVGFAWSVGTALVVPVLAAENVGPIEALKRSVRLIKKAWGEDIIGNVGIGLVFFFVNLAVVLCGVILVALALAAQSLALAIVVGVAFLLGLAVTALTQATLQGIYSAALYRYADGDPATGDIDPGLLQSAFRPR
jgi:hypothetical protein